MTCALDVLSPLAFNILDMRSHPVQDVVASSKSDNLRSSAGNDEVLVEVRQRQHSIAQGFEVRRSVEGGNQEIPMTVCASAVGARAPRDVLLRSPWLARCCAAGVGGAVNSRAIGFDDEENGVTSDFVVCTKVSHEAFEIAVPLQPGEGQQLLAPSGLVHCLSLVADCAADFDAASIASTTLLSLFIWGIVLELHDVAIKCRQALADTVTAATVALTLAAGHLSGDDDLLHRSYWCLRASMYSKNSVLTEWLDGSGPTKLARGLLYYSDLCSTPLRVLSRVVKKDLEAKRLRWLSASDCYTLCRVHRSRGIDGSYPHTYELRLDHSDAVLLRAIREGETSRCRIFSERFDIGAATEHVEDYLGSVVPNFWGTSFTLFDSGANVDSLTSKNKLAVHLPMSPRLPICTIRYETNILGECPRKITWQVDRDGQEYCMSNLLPKWDKTLGSFSLPFFGRVTKASKKNFQMVINGDPNTIYLMFGKVSKDVFSLDFRAPLSPLDAWALALAALAKKRAVC